MLTEYYIKKLLELIGGMLLWIDLENSLPQKRYWSIDRGSKVSTL